MKKFIRVVALLLVLSCFISSVSADEYASRWISFLDYDTGTDNGNYLNFTTSGTMSFTLPFACSVRSVQGYFASAGGTVSSVSLQRKGNSTTYPCTILSLGNSLYRFYLTSTSTTLNSGEFYLVFTNDGTKNTVVNLLEFEYSEMRTSSYPEKGNLFVEYEKLKYDELEQPYYDVVSSHDTMASSSTPLKLTFGANATDSLADSISYYNYDAWVSISGWKKYDFIDFRLHCSVDSINSIVAYCGGVSLPCEVSFFLSDGSRYAVNAGDNWGYIDPYGENTRFTYNDFTTTYFNGGSELELTVRVDLRSLDRTTSNIPYVQITGYESHGLNYDYIELHSCNGYVDFEETDPLYSFLRLFVNGFEDTETILVQIKEQLESDTFPTEMLTEIKDTITLEIDDLQSALSSSISTLQTKVTGSISTLQTKLTSLITGFRTSMESWASKISGQLDQLINQSTSESDDFLDDVATQATELEEITDIIESVTKPPIEDIEVSVDEIVEATDIEKNTAPLALILENDIFLSVCIMSLTFALVSYGLYGKR